MSGAGVAPEFGVDSSTGRLRRALVHRPGDECTREEWQAWNCPGEPDFDSARREHDGFVKLLTDAGVKVEYLGEGTSFASVATYDTALITPEGAVMLRSGHPKRRPESLPYAARLVDLGIPIIGAIRAPGTIDGGDMFWLDDRTLALGLGYRSNAEGHRQLERILEGIVDQVVTFDTPHWDGPGHVFHLMSAVSPVSEDVAVVYPRAAPARLLVEMRERGWTLVEVPDEEFDSMGSNVLSLGAGRAVICAGNPTTARGLQDAGIEVLEYEGREVSERWLSGPTCNTQPLWRSRE